MGTDTIPAFIRADPFTIAEHGVFLRAFFRRPFGTANASLIFRIKGGLPACVPFRQAQGPEPVEGLRLIHLRRAFHLRRAYGGQNGGQDGGQVGEARRFD